MLCGDGIASVKFSLPERLQTEIVISGAGNAEIRVYTELDAQITGVGGIRYHCNLRKVRTSVTGSGDMTLTTCGFYGDEILRLKS
jgi:hypothetical protein